MGNAAPLEGNDGVEKEPKSLRYVYFEDNSTQRIMLPLLLKKKGYQDIAAYDTSDTLKYSPEATIATEEEQNIIKGANVVITDINDGENVDNSNGGTRRGRHALEQGKKVLFITGNVFNKVPLDEAFGADYSGNYCILMKPYKSDDLEKAILGLVGKSG